MRPSKMNTDFKIKFWWEMEKEESRKTDRIKTAWKEMTAERSVSELYYIVT